MPRQPAVPLELQHLLEKRDAPDRRAKQRRGAAKSATKAATTIGKPTQERRAAERRDRARRKTKKV